jgi:predicted Zn-dependent peptidase
MKKIPRLFIAFACVAFIFIGISTVLGQRAPVPSETKLLNGLRVLVFKTPEQNVTIRLRIHAGASFDMVGREGTMRLLTEILFPTQELRSFIGEDFGTELKLSTNYDFIEIQAGASKDKILSLLETIATRLINPEINGESTEAAKALVEIGRFETLEGALNQEAATTLLGTYPHGRPAEGSRESFARIDFADIVQARTRFLSPDNATLAILGDVDEGLMSRASRRLFGPWTRADQKPPWSFASPTSAKGSDVPIIRDSIPTGDYHFRMATRNLARTDPKYPAYRFLIPILTERIKNRFDNVVIEDRGHRIQGVLILGASSRDKTSVGFFNEALFSEISEEEFSRAKAQILPLSLNLKEKWLDADTYGFSSADFESDATTSVSLSDVRGVLLALRENPRTILTFKGTVSEGESKE